MKSFNFEPLDVAEIERNLRLLQGRKHVFEIRALGTDKGTWSGYFDSTQYAAETVVKWSEHNRYEGIYTTLNRVHPGLFARAPNIWKVADNRSTTSDNDIIRRRWILMDVDSNRPSGISATDEELEMSRIVRDAMLDWAVDHWDSTVVAACSGNGSHLLLRTRFNDSKESVKSFLTDMPRLMITGDDERQLLDNVSIDTAVFNPGRITKLYGSYACKGYPTEDRYYRKSLIEKVIEPPNGKPNDPVDGDGEKRASEPGTLSDESGIRLV